MGSKTREPTTLADCLTRPGAASKWRNEGQAGVDSNGTPIAQARLSIADLRLLLDILDEHEDDDHIDDLFDRFADMEEWLQGRIDARAMIVHPSHRLEANDDDSD